MTGWSSSSDPPSTPDLAIRKVILLFDVGGVLVELSGGPESLTEHPGRAWNAWHNSPAVRRYETGQSTTSQFLTDLKHEMSLALSSQELLREFTSWPSRLAPGAARLLAGLRRSAYIVATLSNSNPIHWPMIQNDFRLREYTDFDFPSHITGNLKPDPAAFAQVLDHFGSLPRQVVFFDDHSLNVDEAKKFGFDAYRVSTLEEVRTILARLGIFP